MIEENEVSSEQNLKSWLKLVEWGDKVFGFDAAKSSIIEETELVTRPGTKEPVGTVKRLGHLTDFRFFSMGPVYAGCSIPFDIIENFRATMSETRTRYEGPRIVLEFKHPVFEGLGPWNNKLEGVWHGDEGYNWLVKFMTTQAVRFKDSGTFWRFTHKEILIPDPMAVDRNEYSTKDPDARAVVGLFMPSGNRYRINNARVYNMPPVSFVRESPDPDVMREAVAALSA